MATMALKIYSTFLITLLVAEIAREVNCQQRTGAVTKRTYLASGLSTKPPQFSLSQYPFPQKPQYNFPQKPQHQHPQFQFPQTQFPQIPQYQFPNIPQYQIPQIPQFHLPQIPSLPTSYGQVLDATLQFIRNNQQSIQQKQD